MEVQYMQRRWKKDPENDLNDYISFVIENISLGQLTTEQQARELSVFALTLLAVKIQPKSLASSS
jgi:hypothetical protein